MNTNHILPASTVTVTMFGQFKVETNGAFLTDQSNRSQKIWSVLAYLLMHRNRSVPVQELIEAIWAKEEKGSSSGALKTLLYRTRAMLEPLFGENVHPILPLRGAYQWNPSIACQLDVEQFETLCQCGVQKMGTVSMCISECWKAVNLYQNTFLPKLSDQVWVLSLRAHYHEMYLNVVKKLLGLLMEQDRYEEVTELCDRANQLEPLDETIHIYYIRGLLQLGQYTAARQHYETVTEQSYQQLGVRPSKEFRELYHQIMDEEKEPETNLELVLEQLREGERHAGAFVCEYGVFHELYRLEARRVGRNGTCVHVALMTVSIPEGKVSSLKLLNTTMEKLLDVMVSGLRQGDVISRYSPAQYVIMLPSSNFEDSSKVMDRVLNMFYRAHPRNTLKITYQVREIEGSTLPQNEPKNEESP